MHPKLVCVLLDKEGILTCFYLRSRVIQSQVDGFNTELSKIIVMYNICSICKKAQIIKNLV